MFPATSVARTRKLRLPLAKPEKLTGLVQAAKAAPSKRHSKVAAGSSAANVKVAVVTLVGVGGPDVIVAIGSVRSTVQP